MEFRDALDAYRFIVSWNGRSVYELKDAISVVRFEGAGSIQTSLLDLMNDVCDKWRRLPEVGKAEQKPLWAVDAQGRALVGVPGHEHVVEYHISQDYMNS
jgi:hypothetical protein